MALQSLNQAASPLDFAKCQAVDLGMSEASPAIKPLTRARFCALCYSRTPLATMMSREEEWWSDVKERVLGIVLLDLADNDWTWVVLGRDEHGLFRAVAVNASIASQEQAGAGLKAALLTTRSTEPTALAAFS